jgi:hypothetical protein
MNNFNASAYYKMYKPALKASSLRGYCYFTDFKGILYYYITDASGYIHKFNTSWIYQRMIRTNLSQTQYCIGLDSIKSFYLSAWDGIYKYNINLTLTKSYVNYCGFHRIGFHLGNIYAHGSCNYGLYNFSTNLEVKSFIPLPNNQIVGGIYGFENKLFVSARDVSASVNNILVYENNVLVNSWLACDGATLTTTVYALLVDTYGQMMYLCSNMQKLYFSIKNNSAGVGYYSTYKTYTYTVQIWGLRFDNRNRLVIVNTNNVFIYS